MKYPALFIVAITFFAVSTPTMAAPPAPKYSADGRYGSKCPMGRSVDGPRELCRISFYRLLAEPEKYDGRHILVVGYLVYLFETPVLFPNFSSFDSGMDGEGIELVGAKFTPAIEAAMKKGVWPVYVVGVFDARSTLSNFYRLGLMRRIRDVGLMPREKGRRINGNAGP